MQNGFNNGIMNIFLWESEMDTIKRIPDSELEIMMIIWEADKPVSSAYIIEKLKGEKDWAHTTVLNFLEEYIKLS